jgi:hypothetical protein
MLLLTAKSVKNGAESTPCLPTANFGRGERQAFSNETVKQTVYSTMWTPLIDAILQSVEERFSEEELLALGCGVNAFVSLSDNLAKPMQIVSCTSLSQCTRSSTR